MKLLITIILLIVPITISADEIKIKPLSAEDAIELRVAGESLKQAQEKYDALVKKLEDKVLYEHRSAYSGNIFYIRANIADREWKVTSDYKAFVWVPKEPDLKKTCLIGIGNYR